MPLCEICGKVIRRAIRIEMEGAMVEVCSECASKAKARVLKEVKRNLRRRIYVKPHYPRRDEIALELESRVLRPDYGKIVKEAREKAGLKVEDLARLIGEKTSVIHRIEAGRLKPDLALARKLEKTLKIRLFEEASSKPVSSLSLGEMVGGLTVADILVVGEKGRLSFEGLRSKTRSQGSKG